MIKGYLGAALRREPRCADEGVVDQVRRQQSLRSFPLRMREARGKSARIGRAI